MERNICKELRLVASSDANLQNIVDSFHHLGYSLNILSYSDYLNSENILHDNETILYFDSEIETGIFNSLENNPALIPRMVFVKQDMMAKYGDFLQYCDELVCWPCEQYELECRLRRALIVTNYTTQPSYELDLSRFIELQLVGKSQGFRRVLDFVDQAAKYDSPVLIEGETGTGKEMVARAIHYTGSRASGPFIPLNCGAIPDNLFENELYGHVSGAYTDAKSDHQGLVEQAENGTIFLDEIEALSKKGQVVLLRFLQDLVYKPLGSSRYVKANVRVIAASNYSIEQLVQSGEFRQDLFYRLNLLAVTVPPLRERLQDIEYLAQYFIEKFRRQYDKPGKYINRKSISRMCRHSWPGNVRELENVIHRSFMLTKGNCVDVCVESLGHSDDVSICTDLFGDLFHLEEGFSMAKKKIIDEFESVYLKKLLAATDGNVSRAASIAGKERRALGKLLKKHNIARMDYIRGA